MTDQEIKEMDQFVLQLKAESKFGKETAAQVISDVNAMGVDNAAEFYNYANQHYNLACLEFIYFGRR